MPGLAKHFTVIAPDLLGHGGSAKPTGDYSLGARASLVRDILQELGHDRASFVGHSLGGGMAMQIAYQFPEHCERLILVNSGGLGREVSLLLRAATLPGAEYVLPILTNGRLLDAGRLVGRAMGAVGLLPGTDLRESARGHATLADRGTREAFLRTLRSVVEPGGQRVDATDRLYLAERAPVLFVWGEHDTLIPVSHGHSAHARVPTSRLEVFADSGHFPSWTSPSASSRCSASSSPPPSPKHSRRITPPAGSGCAWRTESGAPRPARTRRTRHRRTAARRTRTGRGPRRA